MKYTTTENSYKEKQMIDTTTEGLYEEQMVDTTTEDLYEVLGVASDASDIEIKKAYRNLARKTHPDFNHAPDANEKMEKINAAYAVLSDKNKRRKYDECKKSGSIFNEEQCNQEKDEEDLFEQTKKEKGKINDAMTNLSQTLYPDDWKILEEDIQTQVLQMKNLSLSTFLPCRLYENKDLFNLLKDHILTYKNIQTLILNDSNFPGIMLDNNLNNLYDLVQQKIIPGSYIEKLNPSSFTNLYKLLTDTNSQELNELLISNKLKFEEIRDNLLILLNDDSGGLYSLLQQKIITVSDFTNPNIKLLNDKENGLYNLLKDHKLVYADICKLSNDKLNLINNSSGGLYNLLQEKIITISSLEDFPISLLNDKGNGLYKLLDATSNNKCN
jgi:hypothetical protein